VFIFEKFFQTDNKNYNNQRNKLKCRLINSETINYFQEQLAQVNWKDVYSNTDVNNAFNYILTSFLNIYEASLSVIFLSSSNDKVGLPKT
jgi:hypothetical protein